MDDIPFYVEFCSEAGGNTLELCCGTGRITIPIAESGCSITGLDISKSMLEVFRGKLNDLPYEVRNKIELLTGDIANFHIGKKFRSIIIPFSSFQNLCSDEEISGCLQCVHEHLEDEGFFVVHCFKPYTKLDEGWILLWKKKENMQVSNEDGSIKFKRTSTNKQIDIQRQIIFSDLFFYTYKNGEIADRKTEHLKLRYYYEEQLSSLLKDNGFVIKAKYGYYDKRSIDAVDATEMIIVSKKRSISETSFAKEWNSQEDSHWDQFLKNARDVSGQ